MHAPLAAATAIKQRTITLTNRAPVVINDDEWEVMSEGKSGWTHPGGADMQSVEVSIRVRKEKKQHPDYIIHAKYQYWDDDRVDDCQTARVGRIIGQHEALKNLWKHMAAVAEELRERIDDEKQRKYVTYALDGCFAKLEPREH